MHCEGYSLGVRIKRVSDQLTSLLGGEFPADSVKSNGNLTLAPVV